MPAPTVSPAMGVAAPIYGIAGKCLDDAGGATHNGNRIQLWDCNGSAAQRWTYTKAGELRGPGGKCLDVTRGQASDGTHVQLWDCNGTQAQQWQWTVDGSILGMGGLCLDDNGGHTDNGNVIQVYGCNGTPAQHWGRIPELVHPSSADAQKGTPGTYANWAWPPGVTQLTDVDFFVHVNTDPGPRTSTFWSSQFAIAGRYGGYIGMQSETQSGRRMFLMSIWNSPGGVAGSPGSSCSQFQEDGTGTSCRYGYPWRVNHTYRFHVAPEGNGMVGATVTEMETGRAFKLGSVQVDRSTSALDASGVSQWTEYIEWNNPRTTCPSQPFSSATMWLQANGGTLMPRLTSTNTSKDCATFSRVDSVMGRVTELNGIGNSVRGPIASLSGGCLQAEAGLYEGSAAIALACGNPSTDQESWVVAVDQTLRLKDNQCLSARGTTFGTPLAIHTCVPGMPTQRWVIDHAQIKNPLTGMCVSVQPGLHTALGHSQLVLGNCAGPGWRAPS